MVLLCTSPKTRKSIIWGIQIIERYITTHNQELFTSSNVSLKPFLFHDYRSQELSKAGEAGRFAQPNRRKWLLQNPHKVPIYPRSYLNAADNGWEVFGFFVCFWTTLLTCKIRETVGSEIEPVRAKHLWSSLVGSGYFQLSLTSIASCLRECMNEPCLHGVSLESHKDNLVLCNLLCCSQVLVHVSTRAKTKV